MLIAIRNYHIYKINLYIHTPIIYYLATKRKKKNITQTLRTWIGVIKTIEQLSTHTHANSNNQVKDMNKTACLSNWCSKTHHMLTWKSVHYIELLPPGIWWNMHLHTACLLLQHFPRSLACTETNMTMTMYSESEKDPYRHFKLLKYCNISHTHTQQTLSTHKFILRITKYYRPTTTLY